VNGSSGHSYSALWDTVLAHEAGLPQDARYWVDDALMAVFHFAIGLEPRREIAVGDLASPRAAVVSALAAAGGAVVPAALFLALTWGSAARAGRGIPMATDPAFAVSPVVSPLLDHLGGRDLRQVLVAGRPASIRAAPRRTNRACVLRPLACGDGCYFSAVPGSPVMDSW
jgi:Na+/H+ antiporter NhaA